MSFSDRLAGIDVDRLRQQIEGASAADVERALGRDHLDDQDIAVLLSPAAGRHLGRMARLSAQLTRQRFGATIQLYAPLYVSNECINRCVYCGFSRSLAIGRRSLGLDEIVREGEIIRGHGFRHLLLVSGEDPRAVTVEHLCGIARALGRRFESISIETGSFDRDGYARLADAGIDGVTLYQETYLPEVYRAVHPVGPKRDFAARLLAVEAAGLAGFRSLGVGALLGLSPWRIEAALLALHARHLQRRFWQSRIAVSFPRIRAVTGGFAPGHPAGDAQLLQMICVMRLALPDAELVLSTREPAALRDALMGIGITRMSAGSRTNPGGYGEAATSGEQFAVEDGRTPAEVAAAIVRSGLEPVWKDFDRALVGA